MRRNRKDVRLPYVRQNQVTILRTLAFLTIIGLLVPCRALGQQQVAVAVSREAATVASSGSRNSSEEPRPQLESLRRRRDMLRQILPSLNSSSAEYRAMERALLDLDRRLTGNGSALEVDAPSALRERETHAVMPVEGTAPARSNASSSSSDTTNSLNPTALQVLAAQSACYPDVPPDLASLINNIATTAANRAKEPRSDANDDPALNASEAVRGRASELLVRSVGQILIDRTEPARQRVYGIRAETRRSDDRQIGASARAGGTTSAAEEPDFARLLAFAIERGAVQREVSGTTLTLSTSLYSLIAAGQGDTATTYRNHGEFSRFGLSASFNIEDQENELASARRSQLAEWSARVRLSRDRSTRSRDYERFWLTEVRPVTRRIPIAVTGTLSTYFAPDPTRSELFRRLRDRLTADVNAYASREAGNATAQQIGEIIRCALKAVVIDPIRDGTVQFTTDERIGITAAAREIIAAELAEEELAGVIDRAVDRFAAMPVATFAYTNVRQATASDYSLLQLLYSRRIFGVNNDSALNLSANAGFSLYHRPDRTVNQQTVRDLAAAFAIRGRLGQSPFVSDEELDQSQMTLTFTGSYQRLFENRRIAGRRPDIASLQFRLDVPFLTGLTIPLAATYSNATEEERRSGWRINFGLGFDGDKLFDIRNVRRLLSNPLGGQ